jgi:acyl transferase domain-containing protein/acyl carrier protein
MLDGAIAVPAPPASRVHAPVRALAPVAAKVQDRREDVQAFLKRTLAQALYLDEAGIDDDRSFVDLGLDSIVGVEWVKSINKGLGLDIAATRVYDYTTIAALAVYLESQLPAAAVTAPAPTPLRAAAPIPALASSTPASRNGVESLLPELRRSLSQALYLDEAATDDDRSFVDLGLDSIVGVEWVKTINKAYGLEISATRVYDHANLRALAAFLHGELAQIAPVDVPAARPMPSLPLMPAPPPTPSVRQRRQRAGRATADADGTGQAQRTDEKIAIVGMSGRYPDAKDLAAFWRNLVEGRNSIKEVPRERWNVDDYYDPTPGKPGRIYCKWLGALDEIECFDPMFFQISPSEAEIMDPQHRLFMQEGYRAFQDAGYSSAALSNTKCGVYLGIMSSEYSFLLAKGNPLNVETTGNSFAIGAARIAYHLNLRGPAIPIDTACSSSLVAIHLACQALLNHEIDMGLAGGVSLYLIPESYLGMCRAGMLSRDGQCKTFDNGADGFVPGEGVGTVVLKRLSDAERDGDSIYGVIIGSGINQDGKTNGITAPSVNSQIDLLREIYRRYDIDASTITYVETHGTGTKLGDPIELEALSTVFKEHSGAKNFCALGAVKTNLGHTSGAAGVAGVHKVLLSLRNGTIAPNVNLSHENALFDFAASPFYISTAAHDWTPAPGHRGMASSRSGRQARRAAVSAFGFSGTNAHVVIEEYARPERPRLDVPHTCIVPLSARTADRLHVMAQELLAFLDANGHEIALRDLAYTLQVGRDPMRERCAWVVDSMAELQARIREFLIAPPGDGQTCHRGTVGRTQDSKALTEQAAALRLANGTRQTPALAALWVQGAELDWPSFHAGATRVRVHHLPGYPFAKERYWPQPAAPSATLPAPASQAEARQPTCYAPEWRVCPLPARRIPFGPDDTLLVIDTDDMLFEQIKARLASPLEAIILVQLGESERQEAPDRFVVDATQPRHFESLLETLRAQGRVPTHVVHNADAARLPASGDDDAAVEGALRAGIDGLLGFCKALVAGGARQSPCAFVSFHHATDAHNSAACQALAAFYRSLALENNRYHGRVLTLEHDGADAGTRLIDTVTCIVNELQSPPQRETEIRCRPRGVMSMQRFVRVLARRDLETTSMGEAPLKHRGVYLVTGGIGGLGYLFARHLAERYRARLVLSGRSALDRKAEDKLERLRALGAEAIYLQASIADAAQAHGLIEQAKARFGALNGVLHCAGVNDDALLIRKSRESFRQVLAPKVQGTWHLDRLTAAEPLDLFVLCSSGAGTFGNAGQTDYAYANAFMDAFAEHRERGRARHERFGRTLSIGWPYWQEGGMQLSAGDLQRTADRTGLCALPTDIGIDYWEKLVRSDLTRALALYGHPTKIAAHCSPSIEPPPSAISTPEQGALVDRDTLLALTERYLCELVHAETKIPVERIDIEERFEAFGFDSIMIGRFNAALERDLGELPKTLIYEFETVAELTAYLCDTTAPALSRVLAGGSTTSAAPADDAREPSTLAAVTGVHAHAEPIAIIGVHASFPQAEGLEALWEHLRSGRDLIQLVPESRWNQAEFFDPDPEEAEHGKIYCKWGGFIDDFDKFDAPFFNIPAHEADILDPQERRFLQSAWAAIEDAGYTRERLKQCHPKGKSADVGVFVGVTTNSYHLLAPEAWQRGQMITPSAMPWSIANRVSYALDLQGPSLPVDTACSSSLVAVHLACESLRRRECQVALAGGVNLYLHPAKYQSFCRRRMLALGDKCRSYGDGDEGFIPGEGVGTLVLKPLGLAERDGDPIYGVIRGSAYDHSGRSNGYATPNPNAQAHVIAQALAQGGVPARSIGFIEGHGTGTRMGDSLEIAAITQAFSRQTTDKQFCAIASLKANIGHAESATSIAGIAKILMQFKHRQIAPSIHADVVNPDIEFARSPCFLQTRLGAWDAPEGQPRRALINAFGAGGVNACAVLEEYVPAMSAASHGPGGRCLFVVSAMNLERLREYVLRHVDHLQHHPDCDIAALCRTVQVGREAMPERLALLVDDAVQLREALERWLDASPQGVSGPAPLWHGSLDPRDATGPTTRQQREKMQALCEARDLAGLARFWTPGGRVEWPRLHAGAPAIAAGVPGYPFARERHWAVDPGSPRRTPAPWGGGPGQADHRPATPTSRLHPLISHNASTLERVRFDAMLDLDQYYARDHRIQGRSVFPGSGFIEMACVAATIAGQRRVQRLKDIFWTQPLVLAESSRNPRIQLLNAGKDGTGFVVTTLDDEQEEVVHCEGRAIFQNGHASGHSMPPSLQEWRQRCRDRRDGAFYYELFRRMGFDYGPSFRVIDEVATGDGCAMARLELHAGQARDFEQYVLHPCLIDGALQTVVALLASGDRGVPHLPFAIDEIESLGGLAQRCHVLAERVGGARDPHTGTLQFNIDIVSDSGEPLVKITNFYVRALVAPDAVVNHARDDSDRLCLATSV